MTAPLKRILIAVAAVVVLILILNAVLKPTAKVAAVTKGLAQSLVPGSVTVQAEYQMELKSEISGRVIKSELDPGQTIKAGSVLVEIDSGDLKLEIEQIQNDYESAKKKVAVGSAIKLELESANESLANFERLTKTGNYPVAELEKQRRLVKQIDQRLALEGVTNSQQLATLENTLKVKRRQLEKMTIVAQFDGVVSKVFARPGDLISTGAPIAIIIATNRTVEAKISEENFSNIELGQKASVRFLGYGDWQYAATVTKILPTADPETQRYIVHLDVKIEPQKLIPGITGEVSIIVGERMSPANIPRRALFGSSVYVVEKGKVRLRTIELGYVSLTKVEVLKGLKAGDLVIVDQLDQFRNGESVRTSVVTSK
ncbi:MAG: efflux RND transporter periplasmic adaptor subunit [Opitutus sp.]